MCIVLHETFKYFIYVHVYVYVYNVHTCACLLAGWSKWPTRQAHDLKTASSNHVPLLTIKKPMKIIACLQNFYYLRIGKM